jgi:hypothetical protein
MDLGHVVLLIAIIGLLLRLRGQQPLVASTPVGARKALLLNARGTLDSIRTITGDPPGVITCHAGRYERDTAAASDHLVYRWR